MKFDSIVFDSMSPDTSEWAPGLKLALGCVPHDLTYRELPQIFTHLTYVWPAASTLAGRFSDTSGKIYMGTTNPLGTSRLLVYDGNATVTNLTPGADYAGAPSWWRFEKYGPHIIAAAENVGVGAAISPQIRTSGAGNFGPLVTSADVPAPKFICSSKSYLVGANNLGFGGAGIYAAADPYRFMWCAQNTPANWTPATNNAAGFQRVNDAGGEITGSIGFKDFFILFQRLGVTLVRWVGGNVVWEQQEIAGADFGIGSGTSGVTDTSIVRANRSVVYFSNRGPAKIDNGTEASHLGDGEVRRFFMDPFQLGAPFDYGIDLSRPIIGDFEAREGYVLWSAGRRTMAGTNFGIIYHVPSGRWSVIPLAFVAKGTLTAVSRAGVTNRLFDPFRLLQDGDVAGLTIQSYSSTLNSSAFTLYSKRWRPSPGEVVSLKQVRPLLLLEPPVGVAYPSMTISITPYTDPRGNLAAVPIPYSYDGLNGGWCGSWPLPMRGEEFLVTLAVGTIGNGAMLREVTGIELGYDQVSSR